MKSKIDFIEGNTRKNLMKMFIPLFLAMTLTMLYSMVDGLWVGNMLGENGMSALTAGTALVLIMNSLAMGMGNGISVMFAHYIGNRDVKKIPGASAAVLTAGIVISLVLTIIVEIMLGRILAFMGTPEEVFSDAILYLRIYMIGNSALFIYMLFYFNFQSIRRFDVPDERDDRYGHCKCNRRSFLYKAFRISGGGSGYGCIRNHMSVICSHVFQKNGIIYYQLQRDETGIH